MKMQIIIIKLQKKISIMSLKDILDTIIQDPTKIIASTEMNSATVTDTQPAAWSPFLAMR